MVRFHSDAPIIGNNMIICICRNINTKKATEILKKGGNVYNTIGNCAKCVPELKKLDLELNSGLNCPHCGVFNKHTECGTYEVLFPLCKNCGECTEIKAG